MLNILAAEDTPAMQRFIAEVFHRRGHSVEIASNGLEAVSKIRKKPFDVVVMDLQMPVMNGLQATIAIRLMADELRSTVPILAFTSHTEPTHAQACFDAGMDDLLIKPVSPQALVEQVEKLALLPRQRTKSRLFHPDWMPNVTPLGDPNPSGAEGINGEHRHWLEANLNQNPENSSQPARYSSSSQQKNWLRTNSHESPMRQSTSSRTSSETGGDRQDQSVGSQLKGERIIDGNQPESRVFDAARVMFNLGADRQLLQILAGFFVESMPQLLRDLTDAIEQKVAPDVQRFAHSLRGLAATFSPSTILETTRKLEVAGKTGDLREAPELVARLKQELEGLSAELSQYCKASAASAQVSGGGSSRQMLTPAQQQNSDAGEDHTTHLI
jgi:CheY-like chemotaxis protein